MARRTTKSKTKVEIDDSVRIAVLYGSEPMLQSEYLRQLFVVMEKAHGEVEQIQFDGTQATLADVFDELRSYGLMQQYKVVVVSDADQFVSTHRAALERYAQQPVDTATLVLRSTRWNKGKLDKAIEKVGFICKCDVAKPPEAINWLLARAKSEHKCKLDNTTARLLVDRLGCNLARLDSELGKLAVMAGEGQPVTRAMVDQVVGRSSEEQAWVVQEAVLDAMNNRRGGALQAVHELVNVAGQPDVLVMYFVADLVCKLNAAVAMKKLGVNEGQIAKDLKLWGPKQMMFMNLVRRLTTRSAARLLDRIVEADRRSKSGGGTPLRNLECFCAVLADEV